MNLDDISGILSSLSDEDMANLNSVAQQFMGGESKAEKEENQTDFFGGIDPAMIAKIMQILPLLQSSGDNDRTRLICALKPLLSPHRRKKADEAMQLLRLIDVLPIVKEFM